MRIVAVVGARPNFVKIAPILAALRAEARGAEHEVLLVHTGQHYDPSLSARFFEDLRIPRPDRNLGVGSGSHAEQTARIMVEFDRVCDEWRPTHLLVVGDVNSTIACALVAAKRDLRIAHVEAGLRSFDRRMPEEINRMLTDRISHLLFTTERSADENLRREGCDPKAIHFVGNVMIDTLVGHRLRAEASGILSELGYADSGIPHPYGLITLHRPASVDDESRFHELTAGLRQIATELPLVFPVHPRTRARIDSYGLAGAFQAPRGARSGIRAIEPLGYLDFLKAMAHARVVLTDSGGIQEETTALGVPCVTLRDSTERPVTIDLGTNVLAGTRAEDVISSTRRQLARDMRGLPLPPLWDGCAAPRIARILLGRS